MITIILSVVAGIILLAIIGMFVYLFITGKKRKMNRGNMRSVS